MSSLRESGTADEPAASDDLLDPVREAVEPVRRVVLEPLWEHVLDPIRRSASLGLATLGLVFFVLGAAVNEGVWAAVLAIWGGGLLLIGLSIYGLIWLKRR